MKTVTVTHVNEIPEETHILLYHEDAQQAAARLEKQTGQPVTVYLLGKMTFLAVEGAVRVVQP